MRRFVRIFAILLGLSLGLFSVVSAQAASIVVTPNAAAPGQVVTISGNVLGPNGEPTGIPPGSSVRLFSKAFPGGNAVPGEVDIPVLGEGSIFPGAFRGQARIRSDAPPGAYIVTGRFAGGNLGVQATITVTSQRASAAPGLPATGHPPEQASGPNWAAAVLVALGLAGLLQVPLWVLRRRRKG